MSALRELEQAATPGPWRGCAHVAATDAECPCRYRGDVSSEATDEMVAQMGAGPVRPDEVEIWDSIKAPTIDQGYANGRLIVALRNAAPALLDLVDAARDYAAAKVRYLDIDDTDNTVDAFEAALDRLDAAIAALDRLPR